MWPVSPMVIIHERMQRRHLARLRRTVGVTGLELPESGRDYPTAVMCIAGIVAVVLLVVSLW